MCSCASSVVPEDKTPLTRFLAPLDILPRRRCIFGRSTKSCCCRDTKGFPTCGCSVGVVVVVAFVVLLVVVVAGRVVVPFNTWGMMSTVRGCPSCSGILQMTTRRHHHFSWAILWTCPACVYNFYCCDSTCQAQTAAAYSTIDQLRRHNYRYHKRQRLEVCEDPHDFSDVTGDEPDVNHLVRHAVPNDAFSMFRTHLHAKRFFEDLQLHSFRVAVQGLVARACFQDPSLNASSCPPISDDDIALFVNIARLVFETGSKQQCYLAEVLTRFESRHAPLTSGSLPPIMTGLPLPIAHRNPGWPN